MAPRLREDFERVPAEEVRERLRRYVVISRQEWENGFSHVFGGDQGGWLVRGNECFQWIVRPGGLAWIVYPDGAAVYLAAVRSSGRESREGGDSMSAMRGAFPAKATAIAANGNEGQIDK